MRERGERGPGWTGTCFSCRKCFFFVLLTKACPWHPQSGTQCDCTGESGWDKRYWQPGDHQIKKKSIFNNHKEQPNSARGWKHIWKQNTVLLFLQNYTSDDGTICTGLQYNAKKVRTQEVRWFPVKYHSGISNALSGSLWVDTWKFYELFLCTKPCSD